MSDCATKMETAFNQLIYLFPLGYFDPTILFLAFSIFGPQYRNQNQAKLYKATIKNHFQQGSGGNKEYKMVIIDIVYNCLSTEERK